MKKVLAIFILIISFFIIYFLQSNIFTWFTIAGVMPNLIVIFILFVGLFTGKKLGLILGIILGFYIDIIIGRQIGISGIMLGLIGLAGEYLDKNFSKESRLTIVIMIISATLVFEVGCYIFNTMTLNMSIEIFSFVKTLLIEILYNIIITIIIYPIMQRLGHILEETFKTRTILTRYF